MKQIEGATENFSSTVKSSVWEYAKKRLPFGNLFNGARTPVQTIKYRLKWRDETEESRSHKQKRGLNTLLKWSGRRDSNSRQSAWKADTLPTELRPHTINFSSVSVSQSAESYVEHTFGKTSLGN